MLEAGNSEPAIMEGGNTFTGDKAPGFQTEKPAPAEFDSLARDTALPKAQNLDFILDIPVEVTVQLGKTRMLVNDLLQLGQGSVVELEKLAGEPVEIVINDKLIARGEVVVVNEKFGVRLTDIISPLDRIKQLK